MTNPEGKLTITLHCGSNGVRAHLESARPVLASKIFEGRKVDDVLRLIPLLFSLCGSAQSVAGIRAIESAQGHTAHPDMESRRDLLLALENLREHMWRILMDWQALQQQTMQTKIMAGISQQIKDLQTRLNPAGVATHHPGASAPPEPATAYLECWTALSSLTITALEQGTRPPARLAGYAACALTALPALTQQWLETSLFGEQADVFVAQPLWHQQCCETGTATRLGATTLMSRLEARRTEARQLLAELDAAFSGARLPASGSACGGISQLEAVRGKLVHAVKLEQDVITHYRVLAPTEWNFHPQGLAAQLLQTLEPSNAETLRADAAWMIQAVDPCVGYDFKVEGR